MYLEVTPGTNVNLAQVRFIELDGNDVDLWWSAPVVGMADKLTIVGGGQALYDDLVIITRLFNSLGPVMAGILANSDLTKGFFKGTEFIDSAARKQAISEFAISVTGILENEASV